MTSSGKATWAEAATQAEEQEPEASRQEALLQEGGPGQARVQGRGGTMRPSSTGHPYKCPGEQQLSSKKTWLMLNLVQSFKTFWNAFLSLLPVLPIQVGPVRCIWAW